MRLGLRRAAEEEVVGHKSLDVGVEIKPEAERELQQATSFLQGRVDLAWMWKGTVKVKPRTAP